MPDPISWSHSLPYFAMALAFGYLLGSIPFGLILTRMAGMGDVRQIGSGNIGATNVLRTGNKMLAAGTLLGDLLKGTVAVLIAGNWGPDTAVIAGLGAFLGHCFPIWLRFKGGKGVATYLGIVLGWHWPAALVFAVIWLLSAFVTRYSSLSALIATVGTVVFLALTGFWQFAEAALALTTLAYFQHRQNIRRLLNGTESKIGNKSSPAAENPDTSES